MISAARPNSRTSLPLPHLNRPIPFLLLTWSTDQIKCGRTSCQGHHGCISIHAFTSTIYSILSHKHSSLLHRHHLDLTLFPLFIHPICGLRLNLTTLKSDLLIFFTSNSSSILSTCPNYHNTFYNARSAKSLTTPDLRCTSSFYSQSIRVTPSILLKHLISITFNLVLSAALIFIASVPYDAVSTPPPSYNPFFT